MAAIAVLGTFDTKGEEHRYVADLIRSRGHTVVTVDVGVLDSGSGGADVGPAEVAAAGGSVLSELAARRDRGEAVAAMTRGAPLVLARLHRDGRIDGVISLGGGGGTAICTAAMRVLPVGFPKLMVSTLASGNTAPYVGVKDIVMMPSVVDVAGLNRLSRRLLAQAAGAICGMVEISVPTASTRPVVVASQFGNTTPCVTAARGLLEGAGFEVMVFAATGVGGRTMESLVESGMVSGVLDITTTEWADEVAGGVLSAGPARCEAAARGAVPAVLVPGCVDMVNFGERSSVPERYRHRLFYQHNAQVTLMRTDVEENVRIGRILAEKCNLSTGPVEVFLPLKGVSVISAPGQPFHWPEADAALFNAWKEGLRPDIRVTEYDGNINDPEFARLCAEALMRLMAPGSPGR